MRSACTCERILRPRARGSAEIAERVKVEMKRGASASHTAKKSGRNEQKNREKRKLKGEISREMKGGKSGDTVDW